MARQTKPKVAAPRLDAAQLLEFNLSGKTCKVKVQAPRVGHEVPEPWESKPDVINRPPLPELRDALQALVDSCYKHREAAKAKGAEITVHGLKVKYKDGNIGYHVMAMQHMKDKPGQVVDFSWPAFVWLNHKTPGLRLSDQLAQLLQDAVDEIMAYVTGHKSAQLSLLDTSPEEKAA